MTRNSLRIVLVLAIMLSVSAFAQTAPTPAAASPAPANAAGAPAGKVGVIHFDAALGTCNEGQRELQVLQKKFDPRFNELAGQAKEVEDLKKELSTKGSMLNEEARGNLTRQIDTKQKALQRNYEDVQNDAQAQKAEIGNRIAQKMGDVLKKYALDNGFTLILDYSREGTPVLWAADQIDITKGLIEAYNQASGIAPPPPATGTPVAPAPKAGTTPRTGTGTAKPATTPAAR